MSTPSEATQAEPTSRWGWRRAAFWLADAVLLVLLVAANLAYDVPPERVWWFQVAAIFHRPLVIALALVGLGAAWRRHWRTASVHAVLCLLAATVPMLRASPSPAPPAAAAPGLTVMTFNANVEYAGAKQDALADLLAREQPHLVALQEFSIVLLHDTGVTMGAPLLAPLLKNRAYQASWPSTRGKDFIFSRPIFSRIEPLGPGELLAGDPPEGLWSAGGVTRRVYDWQGRPIAVYNVHLHSFSSRRPWRDGGTWLSLQAWRDAFQAYRHDFEVRAEQARQLRRMLDAESHPFLVCGDFNSTPRSWVYAHLAGGLRDVFREAGSGWGATFPARLPAIRIDYVLASPDWTVRRAQVDATLFSDHRPVVAELVLGL